MGLGSILWGLQGRGPCSPQTCRHPVSWPLQHGGREAGVQESGGEKLVEMSPASDCQGCPLLPRKPDMALLVPTSHPPSDEAGVLAWWCFESRSSFRIHLLLYTFVVPCGAAPCLRSLPESCVRGE